jgi:hypothetical protein
MTKKLVLLQRCPDCGAKIAVPCDTSLDDNASIVVIIDEDEFYNTMLTHVELNPAIHPTFTKEVETE